MERVKFITLGCKVNQYETQEFRERFSEAGYTEAGKNEAADLYVINTCTVTHRADKDAFYYINRCHRENPKAEIVVTGCMAARERKALEQLPGVSLVVANNRKKALVRLVTGVKVAGQSGISDFEGRTRAFLKIQDGCDNFCSYCAIHIARGRSVSKSMRQIISEARRLADNGFREIVLTGICLGSYGRDQRSAVSLADVVAKLEALRGIVRIRLSSIEARDVSEDLISVIAGSGKLCKHMHIPIQSGDDEILAAMRRKYNRRDYLELIGRIKALIPEISITTDVLVGFPGEGERHFNNTFDLVRSIEPLRTHVFPYSPRPGTKAALLGDRAGSEAVKDRCARLAGLARECSLGYSKRFLGRVVPVLVEGFAGADRSVVEGYADNYIKVRFSGSTGMFNTIVPVKIASIDPDGAQGVI